jgi:hypothetical protein
MFAVLRISLKAGVPSLFFAWLILENLRSWHVASTGNNEETAILIDL